MTVEDLIDNYEEVEDLDVILISHNKLCEIYEGDDFIDEHKLRLIVKNHTYETRQFKGTDVRILDIEC